MTVCSPIITRSLSLSPSLHTRATRPGQKAARSVLFCCCARRAGMPSWKLARQRARDKLLKDPLTGRPYRLWGLTAPTKAFSRLGEDALTYMSLLQDSLKLAVVGTALSVYPMMLNSAGSNAAGLSMWGSTSIGASSRVEWGHVLCDIATTALFAVLIYRHQHTSSVVDKAGAIKERLSLSPHSKRNSTAVVLSFRGASPPRSTRSTRRHLSCSAACADGRRGAAITQARAALFRR